MEDMDAFERQLATVMQQCGRPSLPVDATAIVHSAVTSGPTGRWTVITRRLRGDITSASTEGGFSMFAAVKFLAAGVIVALFGGFLLTGIVTAPQDDSIPPAAATESPSPTTAEELLSGMVIEEVEPGVLRVVNDGVRDLTYPVEGWGGGSMVDITPDGSVWLSGNTGGHGLFRLGEEPVLEDVEAMPPYREVAPDGSLWAIGRVSDDRSGIFSFDGEGWTARATMTDGGFTALAVGPDGTVWVVAEDEDKHCPDIEADDCSGTVLMRLEDDGSLTTIEDWADVYDGDANAFQLAVSPAGGVWLVGTGRGNLQGAELLLRFDGESWEAIPGPGGWLPITLGRYLDFDPDGALLVKASYTGDLARFDDPGWTTFTEADGLQPWGEASLFSTDLLTVAPDGSVWLTGGPSASGCGGVAHYDGTTSTSYLAESCMDDLAIAPDGSVWLRAAFEPALQGASWKVGLYVITPEAVAASQ